MKKTVLIIGDSIFPDSMGGSHRHMYDLSRKLVDKKYKVIVITPNKNNKLPEYELIGGVEYYRYYRNASSKVKGCFDFIYGPLKKYKQLVDRGIKIDDIHGHWPLTNYLIFKKESKNFNIKKIYTFHGPTFEEYSYELKFSNSLIKKIILSFIKFVEKQVLKNSDTIITASQYMKDKVYSIYGIDKNVNIIPVATDVEKFKPHFNNKELAKISLGLDSNKLLIMSIRRLKKRMGIDNLIKAFKIISDNYSDLELIIGGKGDYKNELIKLVKELKLTNNIKFVGFIPDDKLSDFYEAADIFVVPSIDLEGFGLVTTEAMAVGTLVVGTPIGGNKEVIGDFNKNFLTNGIEPNDIAKKLIEIIEQYKNKSYEENIYRKFVLDNYSWEVIINKIINIY